MGFYDFPRSSLVVVSSPKSIAAEWRFVVADGVVVAGSQYRLSGKFDPQPGFDDAAFQLAQFIADLGWEPDPVWVLDVCRTAEGAYHLLEIGGFRFADLYECDQRAVVEAVSSVAERMWGEG